MRIVYFIDGYSACAWYRCITPSIALEERGHETRIEERLRREAVDWADIVVFERRVESEIIEAIHYCRSARKLTVYELDDDFWNIHPDSPAAVFRRPEILSVVEEAIRRVDLVTTTTDHLAARLRNLNPAIHVLPNMLPDEYWPFERPKRQSEGRVVVGWAGSNTHLPDLRPLQGVVEQVLEEFPRVEFAWAGMTEMPFRHERMRCHQPVPLDAYPLLLAGFDIGIAPVVDTVFNRGKSDLKVLEYAMVGIPVIASRTPTYERSIEHGVNGFLAKNPKDWLKYLRRLVKDIELRTTMGANAHRWASSRLMSRNVGLWEDVYASACRPSG